MVPVARLPHKNQPSRSPQSCSDDMAKIDMAFPVAQPMVKRCFSGFTPTLDIRLKTAIYLQNNLTGNPRYWLNNAAFLTPSSMYVAMKINLLL
jgi:hypothetical protein